MRLLRGCVQEEFICAVCSVRIVRIALKSAIAVLLPLALLTGRGGGEAAQSCAAGAVGGRRAASGARRTARYPRLGRHDASQDGGRALGGGLGGSVFAAVRRPRRSLVRAAMTRRQDALAGWRARFLVLAHLRLRSRNLLPFLLLALLLCLLLLRDAAGRHRERLRQRTHSSRRLTVRAHDFRLGPQARDATRAAACACTRWCTE